MYVFLSPTLSCVVCFLSLYTCFLLFVYNLLFLFHIKMPWWVLFKVFQKYKLSKSTYHKLSSYKVFQEFLLGQILLYSSSVNMSWVIYNFSHMFICLLSFCHGLPKGEMVRIYVFHMLRTYVMILWNWFILWQNALYLYLGRLKMCLNNSRNHVSRSSVETFKSVQEIKQRVQTNSLKFDTFSIAVWHLLFVEI